MKHLKLFFALFAMLALGVTNAWAETWTYTFKSPDAIKDNTITVNDVTWNVSTTVGKGSPTMNTGTYSKTYGLKFGSSKNVYYSTVEFTTDYFSSYNVSEVIVKILLNGGVNTILTSKQGDVTIGTSSFNTSQTWTELTTNTSKGNGGQLSMTINTTQAFYISSITVVYESGGTEESAVSLTDEQFAWSAATAEATIGATNTFPTLTNTLGLNVEYASSTLTTATIATDGTVSLVAPGTTTISAKFAGGEVSGTKYATKTVTYALTVLKAPATATDNVYVKVTSTAGITDGEYLIVYEDASNATPAPVAFDGSLTTLDAAKNTVAVEISNSTIAGNTDIDAALFTIDVTTGTLKSASGKYIGVSSNSNGLKVEDAVEEYKNAFSIDDNGNAVITADFEGSTMSLRYNNTAGDNNLRFRYYKNAGQQPIALYKKVDPNAVVEPVFTLAAGEYYGTQSVEITCATTDAKIYYTLDGTDPTSASTEYTGAISISETKTLKAIAIKGENSSTIATATYTILAPLSTMDEIFVKATAVGNTATPVCIKMNNWVVTGVKNSNVYVTDGTKGFIIYNASHGFVVGDQLSGTVTCKVQLYNGSSELTELTSNTDGLTVTTGGVVTPVVVNDVTTLGGVNTGSVIKITGTCETTNTVAGVKLYNSLYAFDDLILGSSYNVIGVYLQYNATKEILPREDADIEKLDIQETATITISNITMEIGDQKTIEATITPDAAIPTVQYAITSGTCITLNGTTITAVSEGTATITATIAEVAGSYYGTTKDFTVTVNAPNIAELPFEYNSGKSAIETTAGMSHSGLGSDYSGDNPKLKFDNTNDNVIIHFNGQADKLTYDIKGNSFSGGTFTVQESADGDTYTDVATHTELGETATQTHTLKSDSRYVKFVYTEKSNGNVGVGNITISKADLRQETGLAWNPETVSITVGDAFTAPTFSNPNSLAVTFNSDNTALATVSNTGVVSLNAGVSGKAVITASYAGDATYKAAEVTCTITVNPKSEKVVILAQLEGQWYAMTGAYVSGKTNVLAAIPVEYINGTLYNVAEADKASIEWQRSMNGNKAAFKNGEGNYLTGGTSGTDLTLKADAFEWDYNGVNYLSGNETTKRTFLYCENTKNNVYGFKNFAISNAGSVKNNSDGTTESYSSTPEVVAPVYATATIYTRLVTSGNFGTICLPYGSSNYSGAEFYEVAGKETGKVYLNSVNTLVAGTPYIFQATDNKISVVYEGAVVGTAGSENGLYGTFEKIDDVKAESDGKGYIIALMSDGTCALQLCGDNCWLDPNRAYLIIDDINKTKSPMPGCRRISMDVQGENETTGVDDLFTTDAPVKAIENGQLIIIRDGVKYNVQGQRL